MFFVVFILFLSSFRSVLVSTSFVLRCTWSPYNVCEICQSTPKFTSLLLDCFLMLHYMRSPFSIQQKHTLIHSHTYRRPDHFVWHSARENVQHSPFYTLNLSLDGFISFTFLSFCPSVLSVSIQHTQAL